MPIRQPQYPIRFTPRGLADALDATDKFPGCCLALQNLVFDQGNPEIMVSRPGVVGISDFDSTLYINMPGVAGSYAATPDAVPLDITGDIDIRVLAALSDWTPSAQQTLCGKYGIPAQGSYLLQINSNILFGTVGAVLASWTANGSTLRQAISTVALPATNTLPLWVRWTLDIDDGSGNRVSSFYWSPADDGVTWYQLGAQVTVASTTSIFNSTEELGVGAYNGGATQPMTGKMYQMQIYNGIAGTLAADLNVDRDGAGGATSVVSSTTGETYTLNGSASIPELFNNPDVISVQTTIGNRTYGMIGTDRNAGKDEPFSYNHETGQFEVVSGVTNGNSPTTQSSTGAWTPPTMASVGVYLLVTHPGFPGSGTMFGRFDLTDPANPAWDAGDLATNALPSVPTAVVNYRNRAWFACGNDTPYTDVLLPLTRTNSSQVLTIGDTADITAFAGLPIQTTSSGISAALLIFKGFQVWQVTGDAATSDLALNFLSLSVGCAAPRSIAQSPQGVYFAATSGPYIVDPIGNVKAVVYAPNLSDPDIVEPFVHATEPTRMAAGYSGGVYRVCLDTVIRGDAGRNDYWFDERRRRWTGPHDFTYDCASQFGNYFVLCSNDNEAELFKSQVTQDSSTVYTDDGATMNTLLKSSTFPKVNRMTQKQVVESTLELAIGGVTTSYAITAQDDQEDTLNSTQITVAGGAVWGSFVWGDGTLWATSTTRPRVYNVPWTAPLVFKKMAIQVSATAGVEAAIGSFYARYQDCGYTNALNP